MAAVDLGQGDEIREAGEALQDIQKEALYISL